MDHRLRTTALVGVAVLLLLGLFASLPTAPAQSGATITPIDTAPNHPWKIESLGTGVKYRRAAFMATDPAQLPWLGAFNHLALNLSYQLSGAPTGNLNRPEIQDGGFFFTINGLDPSDSTAQRCNTTSATTPFPCMLNDGGYCTPTPQPCAQQNNGTQDTVRTPLIPSYSSTPCVGGGSSATQNKICAKFLRRADGSLPADGTPVKFMVKVRWDDQLTVAPIETQTDSNGGAFYQFRLDTVLPNGTLTSISGIWNKKSDRIEAMTNTRTPLLVFNFADATTGSGISPAGIKIFHNATGDAIAKDNTTQYDIVASGDFNAIATYSYAAGEGHPFKANAKTYITAVIRDDSGAARFARDPTKQDTRANAQVGTTAPFTFRGWNLTVDTLAPVLSVESVTTAGNTTTVAPGAQFSVQANATDALTGLDRVHAVLFNASRGLWSDEFVMEPVSGQSKTFRNTSVAVPSGWPDAQISVQINATDKVGNRATKVPVVLALDTTKPAISVAALPAFVRTGPYVVRATILDNGTGIDPASVTLLYKIGTAAETSRTMVNLGGGEFSAEIPDQPDGTAVSYRIRAEDKSGGATTTITRGFVVDKVGPTIGLSPDTDFVGTGPYALGAVIADAGAGVDDDPEPLLMWRTGTSGTFTTQNMTQGSANLWTADVPDQPEGTTIQYFIEAQDTLGNRATKGTSASPLALTVDKTAPTFNMTVPARVTVPEFKIRWSGSDAVSGIDTYTVEFRESTQDDWIGLPDLTNTTATSYDFCAVGGRTYEFRGWSTDKAGNDAPIPAQPLASTVVDSTVSCVAPPNVAVTTPNGGEELTGAVPVTWVAASTQYGSELEITIRVSEDRETWTTIVEELPNVGTYTWQTAETVADGTYWLEVRAIDPTRLVGSDQSDASFTVTNGIETVGDTDNDGLPDAWELEHFGTLDYGPKADPDGDNYFNDEEYEKGTNPANAQSNPGGVGQEWSEAYWLVLALFAAVLVVTVLGFATRW